MFAIKMRASKQDTISKKEKHVSGAERLVKSSMLETILGQLLNRALDHPQGPVDSIHFSMSKIKTEEINKIKSLPITTVKLENEGQGLSVIKKVLRYLNLNELIVNHSIQWITAGASPDGENMRGAIIFDIATMQRLEDNQFSGIRATNMDFTLEAENKLTTLLIAQASYHPKTRDALALATKTCCFPGVIAEVCCSDDPNYTGGYIASKRLGYIRINHLKMAGSYFGGRVILVDSTRCVVQKYKDYLRNYILQINEIDKVESPLSYQDINKLLDAKLL